MFAAHMSYAMNGQQCSPFAQQQQGAPSATLDSAAVPSPVSSNSAGTAVGASLARTASQSSSPTAGSGSSAETPYSIAAPQQQQQQQVYACLMAAPSSKRFQSSRYIQDKEWLYRLITFPSYFTPCPGCTGGARTPKREQLMTQFDTEYPYRVYCSHCPECKDRINSGCLLQVRRSAFKDVVKAADITRFGADVAGVQQYTLNGSKVIYLNREQTQEKKGNNTNAAPAACSVDGRAMMDKSSIYCSLKCKLIAEDPGFTTWLDTQDPSVRIMAQAAANAPPKPTAASKRAAAPSSSASSGGSGACSPLCDHSGVSSGASRPLKLTRTLGNGCVTSEVRPGAQLPLQRTSSAAPQAPGGSGLKRIRITLPSKRQQSAPSGFLEAALAEPTAAAAAAAVDASSWFDLEASLACNPAWDSFDLGNGLDSPCFTAGPAAHASFTAGPGAAVADPAGALEESGSMSPALIHAPSVFSTGSGGADDWWLCGSPADDACMFTGLDSLSGAMLLPSVGPGGSPVGSLGAETTGLQCW